MKLVAQDTIIERSGIDNEKAFSIKASGKAFKILSDGLYSNKIGAVIRELSCNAFDSHVQAGKRDLPFEVHLPTTVEPWFSVKDFGVGLSHEDVIYLYTTYFESTKNNSNDFIGALGLGSKSPFSYVDSFSVTSIFNGVRRAYTAFISEDGTPKISLIHEAKSKEQNGIEVQVPVKDADIRNFKLNAIVFLKHFDPLPRTNIPDLDYEVSTPILKGNGWKYYESRRYSSKFMVIQGHVAYPLNLNSFDSHSVKESIRRMISYCSLDVEFDIGQLEVNAGREALSYDKQTVKNIIDRLEVVYKELKDSAKKYVETFEGSDWEKLIKTREFKNANYELYETIDPDNKLIKNVILNFNEFDKLEVECKNSFSRRRGGTFNSLSKVKGDESHHFSPDRNIHFFINDITRPKTWLLNYFVQKGINFKESAVYILNPNGHDINKILNTIGNPPATKISDLQRPPKVERGKTDKSICGIEIPEEKEESWSCHWSMHTEPNELPEAGLYLEIDRNHVLYKGERFDDYADVLRKAKKLKFFEKCEYDQIHLFKKGQMRFIEGNTGWTHVKDFITAGIEDWVTANREDYLKYLDYTENKFTSAKERAYTSILANKDFKNTNGLPLRELMENYKEYSKITVDPTAISLMRTLRYTPNFNGFSIKSLASTAEEIKQKYPLLHLGTESYYSIDDKLITDMIEYITLIDNKNKTLTN